MRTPNENFQGTSSENHGELPARTIKNSQRKLRDPLAVRRRLFGGEPLNFFIDSRIGLCGNCLSCRDNNLKLAAPKQIAVCSKAKQIALFEFKYGETGFCFHAQRASKPLAIPVHEHPNKTYPNKTYSNFRYFRF